MAANFLLYLLLSFITTNFLKTNFATAGGKIEKISSLNLTFLGWVGWEVIQNLKKRTQ